MKSRIFLATIILVCAGCGFARRDVITKYMYPNYVTKEVTESTTIWTLFKEIEWGKYSSENNKVRVIGPPVYIESE